MVFFFQNDKVGIIDSDSLRRSWDTFLISFAHIFVRALLKQIDFFTVIAAASSGSDSGSCCWGIRESAWTWGWGLISDSGPRVSVFDDCVIGVCVWKC